MTMFKYAALPPAPRRWLRIVLLVCLVILQCLLFGWRKEQTRRYGTTGLRFSQSIPEEVLKTMEEQKENTGQAKIYASFWGQQRDIVKTESGRKAENVFCIGYWGDARDCLPVRYQKGDAPGMLGKECAVSTALAQVLFGSTDAVGFSVNWQTQNYTICGVFLSKDCVLLAPSRENLYAAELRGVSASSPKADAEQWCRTAGLPNPQAIVYGPQILWICDCLCWLPLCAVGLVWLLVFLRLSLTWPALVRWTTWFALALIGALILPTVLQTVPGWLIPGRWSDFSFWGSLGEQISQSRRAWAEAPRFWRDYGSL